MWLRCKRAWVNLGGGPSTEVGPGVLNMSEHKLTLWCFLMRDSQAWLYGVQAYPCSFISFFDSRLKSVSMFFLDSHGQSMSKCQRGAAVLLPFQHRETHVFPFHAHALFIQRSNVCIETSACRRVRHIQGVAHLTMLGTRVWLSVGHSCLHATFP